MLFLAFHRRASAHLSRLPNITKSQFPYPKKQTFIYSVFFQLIAPFVSIQIPGFDHHPLHSQTLGAFPLHLTEPNKSRKCRLKRHQHQRKRPCSVVHQTISKLASSVYPTLENPPFSMLSLIQVGFCGPFGLLCHLYIGHRSVAHAD